MTDKLIIQGRIEAFEFMAQLIIHGMRIKVIDGLKQTCDKQSSQRR